MSTGQTLLAIGAIALFMYLSVNISQSYLLATTQTVDQQSNLDAVNFGQSLAEQIYATKYDTLEFIYGKYNDVLDPNSRMSESSASGDTLYAEIDISAEKPLIHGVDGKVATIKIFMEKDDNMSQKAGYKVALTEME